MTEKNTDQRNFESVNKSEIGILYSNKYLRYNTVYNYIHIKCDYACNYPSPYKTVG